jgi:hypothetical protein
MGGNYNSKILDPNEVYFKSFACNSDNDSFENPFYWLVAFQGYFNWLVRNWLKILNAYSASNTRKHT